VPLPGTHATGRGGLYRVHRGTGLPHGRKPPRDLSMLVVYPYLHQPARAYQGYPLHIVDLFANIVGHAELLRSKVTKVAETNSTTPVAPRPIRASMRSPMVKVRMRINAQRQFRPRCVQVRSQPRCADNGQRIGSSGSNRGKESPCWILSARSTFHPSRSRWIAALPRAGRAAPVEPSSRQRRRGDRGP